MTAVLSAGVPATSLPSPAATAPFSRRDGRTPSQLRPLSYEQSLLHRADGSVRYSQGSTTLIVAVYGPTLASAREEQWDRAALVFSVSSASAASAASTATAASSASALSSAALCHHLQCAFEPVVVLGLQPRHRVAVHVELLTDDGALLACAVNATMIALMDAGIQCREMIAAVALRIKRGQAAAHGDNSEDAATVLLDPSREETEVRPPSATHAPSCCVAL